MNDHEIIFIHDADEQSMPGDKIIQNNFQFVKFQYLFCDKWLPVQF